MRFCRWRRRSWRPSTPPPACPAPSPSLSAPCGSPQPASSLDDTAAAVLVVVGTASLLLLHLLPLEFEDSEDCGLDSSSCSDCHHRPSTEESGCTFLARASGSYELSARSSSSESYRTGCTGGQYW